MIDLRGRVALVTGGSRGIGAACVELLHDAGAEVAFTYQRAELAAEDLASRIKSAGGICEAVRLDLSSPTSAESAVSEVIERLGRIDILVNNAGIWNPMDIGIQDLDSKHLDMMIDVNLKGVFHVTRFVVRDMMHRGFGRVISIGSTAGVRGEAFHSHYAAAKGALFAWTRSLAVELSPRGIHVNLVSPGWVFTDMTQEVLTPARIASIEAEIPTRRLTRPDDVAGAVLFLASPLANQITGANIDVNGGAVFS